MKYLIIILFCFLAACHDEPPKQPQLYWGIGQLSWTDGDTLYTITVPSFTVKNGSHLDFNEEFLKYDRLMRQAKELTELPFGELMHEKYCAYVDSLRFIDSNAIVYISVGWN